MDYTALAHYKIKHNHPTNCEAKNEFTNGKNYINSTHNFWGYSKHRLNEFKGIKRENCLFCLKKLRTKQSKKECKIRLTNLENLCQILLKMIKVLVK